jgi:hypothetical protein
MPLRRPFFAGWLSDQRRAPRRLGGRMERRDHVRVGPKLFPKSMSRPCPRAPQPARPGPSSSPRRSPLSSGDSPARKWPNCLFGAHSLRAGFLTSAARRGASVLPALVALDRERLHAVRARHRLDRSLNRDLAITTVPPGHTASPGYRR